MILDALTFRITDLATGRLLGRAVVCVAAEYAAVTWTSSAVLNRKGNALTQWSIIGQEIALGVPPGPLSGSSRLCQLLTLDADAMVECASREWLNCASSQDGEALLDDHLMAPVVSAHVRR